MVRLQMKEEVGWGWKKTGQVGGTKYLPFVEDFFGDQSGYFGVLFLKRSFPLLFFLSFFFFCCKDPFCFRLHLVYNIQKCTN